MRIILLLLLLTNLRAATIDDVVNELQILNAETAALHSDLLYLYNELQSLNATGDQLKAGLLQWRDDQLHMVQIIMIAVCFGYGALFWFHILKIKNEREFW